LTRNSARLLARVLAALDWCDEVVMLDTGSTDATTTIAAAFSNVRVHQLRGPFPGFGLARRHAILLARNDWILSVDSDEIVSAELAREIRAARLDPRAVYAIPFRNYFRGQHITTCGWWPDRHERLFHRHMTRYSTHEVHEHVETGGMSVLHLRSPIDHYSYESLEDFLRKMAIYAQLFAHQNAGLKSVGATSAVTRSLWAFCKSYFLKRGFAQGEAGLVISAYKAQTVFWKYLMLREANRNRAG